MGCIGDIVDSALNFFGGVINAIFDAVSNFTSLLADIVDTVLTFLWKQIALPILEWLFSLLGYTDEDIYSIQLVTNKMIQDPQENNLALMIYSAVKTPFDIIDAIKQLVLGGAVNSLNLYRGYGKRTYIFGLPTVLGSYKNLNKAEVKIIIEGIDGEAVTIVDITLTFPFNDFYIPWYLQENEPSYDPATGAIVKTGSNWFYDFYTEDVMTGNFTVNLKRTITTTIDITTDTVIATIGLVENTDVTTTTRTQVDNGTPAEFTDDTVIAGPVNTPLVVVGLFPGIYNNTPILGVSKLISNGTDTCVTFNGSTQYIGSIGVLADFNFIHKTAIVTIETIINVDSLATTDGCIIGNAYDGINDYGFNLTYIAATDSLEFTGLRGAINLWAVTTANNSIVPGTTYHITCTVNAGVAIIYINGVSAGTDNTIGVLGAENSTDILNIARCLGNTATPINYFDGTIDKVTIYNIALTSIQVTAHYDDSILIAGDYNNTILTETPIPIAYWKLSEASGVNALNYVGPGNNDGITQVITPTDIIMVGDTTTLGTLVPPSVRDSFYQVKYNRDLTPTVNRYWYYQLSLGTYPTLDNSVSSKEFNNTEMLPIVPIRENFKNVSSPNSNSLSGAFFDSSIGFINPIGNPFVIKYFDIEPNGGWVICTDGGDNIWSIELLKRWDLSSAVYQGSVYSISTLAGLTGVLTSSTGITIQLNKIVINITHGGVSRLIQFNENAPYSLSTTPILNVDNITKAVVFQFPVIKYQSIEGTYLIDGDNTYHAYMLIKELGLTKLVTYTITTGNFLNWNSSIRLVDITVPDEMLSFQFSEDGLSFYASFNFNLGFNGIRLYALVTPFTISATNFSEFSSGHIAEYSTIANHTTALNFKTYSMDPRIEFLHISSDGVSEGLAQHNAPFVTARLGLEKTTFNLLNTNPFSSYKMFFSPDGLKLYFIEDFNQRYWIYQANLTIPGDYKSSTGIGPAVKLALIFIPTPLSTFDRTTSIIWGNDGNSILCGYIELNADSILKDQYLVKFDVSSPYDIYSTITVNSSVVITNFFGFVISVNLVIIANDLGTEITFTATTNAWTISLSTSWDINTAIGVNAETNNSIFSPDKDLYSWVNNGKELWNIQGSAFPPGEAGYSVSGIVVFTGGTPYNFLSMRILDNKKLYAMDYNGLKNPNHDYNPKIISSWAYYLPSKLIYFSGGNGAKGKGFFELNLSSIDRLEQFATSKEILRIAGVDMLQIQAEIDKNPDINQIEDAFILFAINIYSQTQHGLEALYIVFQNLFINSDVDKIKYEASLAADPTTTTNPSFNSLSIVEQKYNHVMIYNYIEFTDVIGVVNSVGDYSSVFTIVPNVGFTEGSVPVTGQPSRPFVIGGGVVSYVEFRFQYNATNYYNYKVHGLFLSTNILTTVNAIKTQITELFSISDVNVGVPGFRDNFIIPLPYDVFLDMEFKKREQLVYESLTMVIYATNHLHLEWYETPSFLSFIGTVIKFISIVILFISWGTATSWSAALWALAEQLLIQYALGILLKEALKQFGKDDAARAAIYAAYIYASSLNFGGSSNDLSTAELLLLAVQGIVKVAVLEIDFQTEQLGLEQDAFLKNAEERKEELDQAKDLLGDTSNINSLLLKIYSPINSYESPEDFFERTIHNSNPGIISLEQIGNYVENKLKLPQLDNNSFDPESSYS